MNEIEEEHIESEVAVSEPLESTQEESIDESKMVPLAALQSERKKRQEEQARRIEAETRYQMYQEQIRAQQQESEVKEDPNDLITNGKFKEEKALTKREIREEVYRDMNPEAVQKIDKYLDAILEKKPWLQNSLISAPNRYSRAYEIVNDYLHLVEEPKSKTVANDAKRIVENAQKPRSPVEIGKSARPSGIEYLKSIQGKKEFREYRQKLLQGEL